MSATLITNHQAAVPEKEKENIEKGTHSFIVLIYSSHLRLHVESYEKTEQV